MSEHVGKYTAGYARISFDHLDLEKPRTTEGERPLSTELKELRERDENYIYGLVDRQKLGEVLRRTHLTTEDLYVGSNGSLPWIHPGKIKCLSGFDFIEAAKASLPDTEHWWNVRLFYNGALLRRIDLFLAD